MTVLAEAAKIGYKLGRDKRYKRMGAKGATGHYRRLVSSRVTGPQSFDQMVWPYAWGCVGLGQSHGRRGTGQTRVGFVHQRFPSPQYYRAVFDARFILDWQIFQSQSNQSQRALHRGVQKPPGSNGHTDHFTASLSLPLASSCAYLNASRCALLHI